MNQNWLKKVMCYDVKPLELISGPRSLPIIILSESNES